VGNVAQIDMMRDSFVRLTTTTSGGGCSSKVGSADLAAVLRDFPAQTDPDLIVGLTTSDDAGVYRLSDELALVQTVDFFTPIVDDPYDFGRIAAANAISDVYAMGGTPRTALNIATFPIEELGHATLARILAGGAAVAREAGVAILGGHTVKDDEPAPSIPIARSRTPAPARATCSCSRSPSGPASSWPRSRRARSTKNRSRPRCVG
jgi:selenide,water dikinase